MEAGANCCHRKYSRLLSLVFLYRRYPHWEEDIDRELTVEG